MNIFDREDKQNYRGLIVFKTFERVRHFVNTLDKEIINEWSFQHSRNRFTRPSGATVMVAKIKDINDCYQLSGMEFQHLVFADHIPSPMSDYLKSMVRSADPEIKIEVEHGI